MTRPLIFLVAGARPNFMKIAPIIRALVGHGGLDFRLVHTGQHYDHDMSDVFFEELGIPQPDFHLDAGGGSHAEQTAKIMVAFEAVCQGLHPDCVLVVGDVNSTLACSIVAKKMHIPVAHVEAGLRSGDRRMPEEINRLVTDSISDWFFASEPSGADNLRLEGHPNERIFLAGNVMVDNLLYQVGRLEGADLAAMKSAAIRAEIGPAFGVITLHRPSNVDSPEILGNIVAALTEVSERLPLVFPVHPRTRATLERFGINPGPRVLLCGPLPYMDFLNLWSNARLVLTDSGGLQEETTALGIACVTLRENTERPITVEEGTNVLVGTDRDRIVAACHGILDGKGKSGRRPDRWDGRAAERIVATLAGLLTPSR
jgi:UDP-N-acetylglucosamine 2-epimerase (non-hydrolysing)